MKIMALLLAILNYGALLCFPMLVLVFEVGSIFVLAILYLPVICYILFGMERMEDGVMSYVKTHKFQSLLNCLLLIYPFVATAYILI